MRYPKGLSVLETLIAVSVLGMVLLSLSLLLTDSLRQTSITGSQTQAVQILNYVGRRIVGGETDLVNLSPIGYGNLRQVFPELSQEIRHANPDLYKVEIRGQGTPTWAGNLGISLEQYEIRVCWKTGGRELCTSAHTYSSPPASSGGNPPLPGIN